MNPEFKMRWKPSDAPETRVGICCGDACRQAHNQAGTWAYALLFKIQGYYRYRCSDCFKIETGKPHHLDPAVHS